MYYEILKGFFKYLFVQRKKYLFQIRQLINIDFFSIN